MAIIINTITVSKISIHNGHNTHNQDQLITPTNLSTTNTIVNTPQIPIPELLLFLFELIFASLIFTRNCRFIRFLKITYFQINLSKPLIYKGFRALIFIKFGKSLKMPYFTQFLTVFKFSCPTTLDFTRVTDRMKSVFPWLFESLKRPIYGHSRNSLLYYSLKILTLDELCHTNTVVSESVSYLHPLY